MGGTPLHSRPDHRAAPSQSTLHGAHWDPESRRYLIDRQIIPVEHFEYLSKHRWSVVHGGGNDSRVLTSREKLVRVVSFVLLIAEQKLARRVEVVSQFARADEPQLHAEL